MIDISNEDFATLCICALRYCHGRRSYMPHLVQTIVEEHFGDIPTHTLNIIIADKDFQTRMDMWGDEIDKYDWENFYAKLNEFIEANVNTEGDK